MLSSYKCLYCPTRLAKLKKGIAGVALYRGVCNACYQYIRNGIMKGKLNESELIKNGLLKESKPSIFGHKVAKRRWKWGK